MAKATEHGIDGAVYSWQGGIAMNEDGENVAAYDPTLFCLCGEHFTGGDWAEAGACLDEHLMESAAKPKRPARAKARRR